MLLRQRVHLRPILGSLGLLLHVPALMSLITLVVCFCFHEWDCTYPFLIITLFSVVLGQSLYRRFKDVHNLHLWDAMIIAALGWLICPMIGAVPFYWIAKVSHFPILSDALFEAFSGFTSTGLTILDNPEELPYCLQWWRSLSQWIGGIGLIVFILSLTQPNRAEFSLYYSEARSEMIGDSVPQTARRIWAIYLVLTALGVVSFIGAGMPPWAALNNAMTAIATGGFTTTADSFASYNGAIKSIAIVLMILGSVSFAFLYHVFCERKWSYFLSEKQHHWLLGFLLMGLVVSFFYDGSYLDTFFSYVSAYATCGFTTTSTASYMPSFKILLLLGMLIGGAVGSTTGGIKLQRFRYLFSGIFLRIQSITQGKERHILQGEGSEKGPSDVDLPNTERTMRIFAASIVLTLWFVSTFSTWFILMHTLPETDAMDALFDIYSAIGNVGLTTGIIGYASSDFTKYLFIFLMWIGRLEIIPVLVLLFSFITTKKTASE